MSKYPTQYKKLQVLTLRRSQPWLWVALLLILLAVSSLGLAGCGTASAPAVAVPATITVDEAYEKYQQGVFFLDVRTQEEWDDYHAPNSTLIPLDQLSSRVGELPQGEEIVVVCRSGNRSQQGRDILRSNGLEASTSMAGGLKEWRAAGYPIE